MTNVVVCRLCLHDTDSYLDLYSNNSQPSDIDKKILRYLGLQVSLFFDCILYIIAINGFACVYLAELQLQ